MYKEVCQIGRISLLYTVGNKPLLNWGVHNKNGTLKRLTDDVIGSLILEFKSPNPVRNYIECPANPREQLGIHMKFLVLIMKNMYRPFSFQVDTVDMSGSRRIFRMNNYSDHVVVHPFTSTLPLTLYRGWNTVVLDLNRLMQNCYKQAYSRTTRLRINSNFTLRRVFFSDRAYKDSELPASFTAKIAPNLQAPLVF